MYTKLSHTVLYQCYTPLVNGLSLGSGYLNFYNVCIYACDASTFTQCMASFMVFQPHKNSEWLAMYVCNYRSLYRRVCVTFLQPECVFCNLLRDECYDWCVADITSIDHVYVSL